MQAALSPVVLDWALKLEGRRRACLPVDWQQSRLSNPAVLRAELRAAVDELTEALRTGHAAVVQRAIDIAALALLIAAREQPIARDTDANGMAAGRWVPLRVVC